MLQALYQDILDLHQAGILQTSGYDLLRIKYGHKRLIQSLFSLQREQLISLDLQEHGKTRIVVYDQRVSV